MQTLTVRVQHMACDICGTTTPRMFDARTHTGPWGFFCLEHFYDRCPGNLGTGIGQEFHQQPDGTFVKVAG